MYSDNTILTWFGLKLIAKTSSFYFFIKKKKKKNQHLVILVYQMVLLMYITFVEISYFNAILI